MNKLRSLFRKRLVLPVLSLMLITMAGLAGFVSSDRSRIVIYNETGNPIGALKVEACGQSIVFRNLADEGSVRWDLAARGSESDIALETAVEPAWRWRGGYVEPRGGYRITLRVWPDGQVEEDSQISVWQRWRPGSPSARE